MKKNVIALAVAAAMAAPLAAQAEATVSGQLQVEMTSLSIDQPLAAALNKKEGLFMNDAQELANPDSGNFGALNFSASEDLGGGMKAIAKVGLNVWAADHNDKGVGTRDAYVGLSGNFGTVLAGTMSTPYKMATVKWDPFLATSAQARSNFGMSDLHNGYAQNALAYANKFGMAKVVAAIVIDETQDATSTDRKTGGNHAISFSVNAPVGPVELAIGYADASEFGDISKLGVKSVMGTSTVGVSSQDLTATKVGVKYAAGAMSVAFQMENIDMGAGAEVDYMYLNGTYTAGANTFAAAYGQQEVDGTNTTQTYMSLGMVHGFSKTVSAHVGYIAMDSDTTAGDASGIAAGLRVKF